MAAVQDMRSPHQENRQPLAAKRCGCAPQVLSTRRGTDQMSYEFLLMVQCVYIEYLEMSKNYGISKVEDGFSL